MDKAGEAMLEGMIALAVIGILLAGGVIWLVRRSSRNRRERRPDD